jgi:hypothetical protein
MTSAAPPVGPTVTGYRTLSESDIALMNTIKAKEAGLAELVNLVRLTVPAGEPQRQCALAVTAFEEAFMRLVRAVAQPANPFVRHAAPSPHPLAASIPVADAPQSGMPVAPAAEPARQVLGKEAAA